MSLKYHEKNITYPCYGTLFIAGCFKYEFNYQKTTVTQYFNLNDTVSIHVRQTLIDQAEGLSITFDSVKNDSRCPTGAECDQVGNAAVVFLYNKGVDSVYFTLNTEKYARSDTTINNYNIQLIKLLPYPTLHKVINLDTYYARILIRKTD